VSKGLRERAASEAGFTMAEVLVVILITGLLATFALPSFLGQQSRSNDNSSKVIARSAAAAMESYAQDNLGAYDGATGSILHSQYDIEVPSSTTVLPLGCTTGFHICYLITTPANPATGTTFTLMRLEAGTYLSDCDVDPSTSGNQHGKGGCPSDGKWDID
jgi:prepilin-type N-terminal cleavage/methylation domain-containing protein